MNGFTCLANIKNPDIALYTTHATNNAYDVYYHNPQRCVPLQGMQRCQKYSDRCVGADKMADAVVLTGQMPVSQPAKSLLSFPERWVVGMSSPM